MKPIQFAQKWCANYQSDGSCLRAEFPSEDGKRRILKPLPKCLLNDPIRRCLYFEESVLPQNFRLDSSESYTAEHRVRLAKNRSEQEEASHAYRMSTGTFSKPKRVCPVCNDRGVPDGAQFCPTCAEAREKESRRERNRRYHEKRSQTKTEG